MKDLALLILLAAAMFAFVALIWWYWLRKLFSKSKKELRNEKRKH